MPSKNLNECSSPDYTQPNADKANVCSHNTDANTDDCMR